MVTTRISRMVGHRSISNVSSVMADRDDISVWNIGG